ncbi:tryptophan--tRNA ligase [Alphaproteobacteria bacterium]|jgi:tryptophanyl-tRNA synthetase|nr:tryptophan--tRNA ligase [Alphaproteobacteria bacterium]MDB2564531.1 tryptophan--tRNA ligase [Alphaproteobacteria bacterium]MDB3863482.1 tryptophan--tRNA ligase [Alphaproteobacteria bacterium]MDB3974223.1 tryptophan--tRNA ligase [Alphaproteobacteria bacterium]MDC0968784.1 tryptophan--tRNA ligase [Alphaproteobacteria bacterium]|tara:strand:+ start:166 stop:1170 length:1005 start_codon:yes stop_codon:yes gene_type:complete
MTKFEKRVFSGVQPTGTLHLGNYLGAIKNFVELQENYNCIYCVVDQHAITVDQNPSELRSSILEVLASFIAAGVDYKNQIIFQQSSVPAHSQLAWVFNCVSRIGWLNRMTQFKDKAGKNRENVSVGLMVYPNLMAADILAYLATHVPVGDDQKQHLELSRDIAQKFNNDFGVEYFPQPEPLIYGNATRVMSLRDGTKKMSKSDPSDFSRILLTDENDSISSKIKKAKSDSELIPDSSKDLQSKPECMNLINILSACLNQSVDQTLQNYSGKEYSMLKKDLAENLVQIIGPIRDEIKNLLNNKDELDLILKDGTQKAANIANPIIEDVYKIVGFK